MQSHFQTGKQEGNFFSTYAPTLEVSEKDNKIRDEYYAALDDTIKKVNNRDILIISGDMNAETGTGHANYPECIGRYGKGEINSNGVQLAELASQNELCLTNTFST